ncbi:MAG: response regulator transcription factor [Burkholderiales bacterium]|nr:response regulator transcription factor [Burkholderiales bacterium]
MNPLDIPAHLRDAGEARPRVLVVGDDARRARRVGDYLSRQPLALVRQERGDAALGRAGAMEASLVVIESDAPGLAATEFCRRLRAGGGTAPVVVLAATDDEVEQVLCLELGADACLPRDVPERLLWAQVRALLRRAPAGGAAEGEPGSVRAGDLVLERRALAARAGDRRIELTPHEFDCAWLLAREAGAIVSRARLREAMCRGAPDAIRDRTVDACISRLRRKLVQLDGRPRRIRSIHGRGYLLDASPA